MFAGSAQLTRTALAFSVTTSMRRGGIGGGTTVTATGVAATEGPNDAPATPFLADTRA
jgi:hypothetical protein